jgi:YVTN family beta-propeller protein
MRLRTISLCALVLLCISPALVPIAVGAQGHAYVANSGAHTVTVIDTASDAVIGAIPVGLTPRHVVVTPDGARVFVTNADSDSISVIDTTSNTVAATFPVGDSPSTLIITPDGQRAYVTIAGGFIQVIDTISNTVLDTITVGASGDIAVTPDGSRVYVTAGLIYVIETASNAVVASFPAELDPAVPAGNSARSIAIRPDGRAYVTVSTGLFSGGIVVLDTNNNSVVGSIGLGSIPGPIAMTLDGSRAYVAVEATWVDTGYGAGFFPGRTISVLDTITNAFVAMIDLGAGGPNWTQQNTAKAIAVTPDRSAVYVSVPRINVVEIANVNTNLVSQTVPVTGPGRIGIRSAGNEVIPYALNAMDDSGTVSTAGGTAIANVLANDRIGGAPVTLAHVRIGHKSPIPGIMLGVNNGSVQVAPATPVGTYTLSYRICENASPSNCDTATVTVNVRDPYVIDARNDATTSYPGRTALSSVLVNDTLAGVPATTTTVQLSSVAASTDTSVALDLTNGSVYVAAGTSTGIHKLIYKICETASLSNCDNAMVTITVIPFPIDAVNDAATIPRTGGTALTNVLANDLFAGAPATLANVSLAQTSSSNAGVTLNHTNGSVSVAAGTAADTHMLTYEICEIANPSNCDSATVSVTVTPYVVDAVNDFARASSKRASIALPSVLTNDRFAGGPATVSNVQLSLVSLTPANNKIRLDLTDGSVDVLDRTDSGTYLLVYKACEIASPTNCDQATVTLELSGGL